MLSLVLNKKKHALISWLGTYPSIFESYGGLLHKVCVLLQGDIETGGRFHTLVPGPPVCPGRANTTSMNLFFLMVLKVNTDSPRIAFKYYYGSRTHFSLLTIVSDSASNT